MSEQRMRRRMDRRQLNDAARKIAQLVRSRSAVASKKQPKPETTEDLPPERGYRKSVNIGFGASDLENLETILAEMRRDPGVRALQAGLGLAKQTRYAIAKYAEILRAKVTTG